MPMTHIQEIGAENSYQQTSTNNRHEIEHVLYTLPETERATRKVGTRLIVRRVRNWYWFPAGDRILAPISGKCVTGISRHFILRTQC